MYVLILERDFTGYSFSGMQDCYEFFEWDARAIEVIKSESTENWISINFPQINPVKNGEW